MSVFSGIRNFLWGEPAATKAERKLLVKIDFLILSYVCLAYFINSLDRANLASAYVTGMKEDLKMVGNVYTYAQSCFTAGYIVGQWPAALAVSSNRIPIRIFLPGCVFIWGLLTIGQAFVTNYESVYAIRFIQGIFEASTFGGTHYILGSWYKPSELGKRTAIYTCSAQVGNMFSGIMQGAITTNLGGRNGLAAWRWLFLIDAMITIPIAMYGYLVFPNTPETTTSWFLTAEERELCVTRLPPRPAPVKMTMKSIWEAIKLAVVGWRWWAFTLLFTISATSYEATVVYTQMALWLKSVKVDGVAVYTAQQINYYPSMVTATAVVTTVLLTMYSDYTRNRFLPNPIMAGCVIIMSIILLVWNVPTGAHFFALCIGAVGYAGQASNFAWANELTPDNDTLRAVTLFSMNLFSNVWNLWYQIVVFPVVEAPQYRNGQIATIVTALASVAIAAFISIKAKQWFRDHPEYAGHQIDRPYRAEDESSDMEKKDYAETTVQPVSAHVI